MQNVTPGAVRDQTGSGGTGLPRQRWAWTHRYGVPLFVASLVAVVLTGSGLTVAMLVSGGDPGGPGPEPTTSPVPSLAADCEVGSWQAVVIEEDIDTGDLELVDPEAGPTFTYREDGSGEIDFGERTAFMFYDRLFGRFTEPTQQYLTGVVTFDYIARDDTMRHEYINIEDGARMIADPLPIPDVWYVPRGEIFSYECDPETMILDADSGNYYVELRRLVS